MPLTIDSLKRISELVNDAVEIGKEIDVKSDKAHSKIEEVSKKLKKLTNKTKNGR